MGETSLKRGRFRPEFDSLRPKHFVYLFKAYVNLIVLFLKRGKVAPSKNVTKRPVHQLAMLLRIFGPSVFQLLGQVVPAFCTVGDKRGDIQSQVHLNQENDKGNIEYPQIF